MRSLRRRRCTCSAPRTSRRWRSPRSRRPGASARVFWDRADYGCYFHGEGLAPLADGRTYVLWVSRSAARRLAAGSFTPDARGEAVFVTRLPKDLAPIARALVTEEPVAHGTAPTGAVQLAAGGT